MLFNMPKDQQQFKNIRRWKKNISTSYQPIYVLRSSSWLSTHDLAADKTSKPFFKSVSPHIILKKVICLIHSPEATGGTWTSNCLENTNIV